MPASISMASPKCSSAALSLPRLSGAKPKPNRSMGPGVDPASGEIGARLAALEAGQLLGEPFLVRRP